MVAEHDCLRTGAVGQQGLLPKPTDSKLWLLEVRPGMERQLVVSLMQKATQQPLLLKSAFMQDHLPVRSNFSFHHANDNLRPSFGGATGHGAPVVVFLMQKANQQPLLLKSAFMQDHLSVYPWSLHARCQTT